MWFKMRVPLIVLVVGVLSLAKASYAAEKEDLARDLMNEMNIVDMTKESTDVMMQQMGLMYANQLSQVVRKYSRSESRDEVVALMQASLERMITKIKNEYLRQMDFNELVDKVYLPIYVKYFSEAELNDLIAFYRSSTGKRTLETTPLILEESMQKSAVIIQPLILKISSEVSAVESKLLKEQLDALELAGESSSPEADGQDPITE